MQSVVVVNDVNEDNGERQGDIINVVDQDALHNVDVDLSCPNIFTGTAVDCATSGHDVVYRFYVVLLVVAAIHCS